MLNSIANSVKILYTKLERNPASKISKTDSEKLILDDITGCKLINHINVL